MNFVFNDQSARVCMRLDVRGHGDLIVSWRMQLLNGTHISSLFE